MLPKKFWKIAFNVLHSMKTYRIVRLAALHSIDASNLLEKQYTGFNAKTYAEQRECLFNNRVFYSDSFSRSLRSLGHDATEIVWDFELLQKQWSRENRVKTATGDWTFDILMSQIEQIRPDVVYFQGTELASPGRFRGTSNKKNLPTILKEEFPFIKLIAMYSGFPSRISRIKSVDVLFSGPPFVLEHYGRMGVDAVLCYHAFDSDLLRGLEISNKQYGCTFAGSARPPESRYWALRELLKKTNIEIWVDEPKRGHRQQHLLSEAQEYFLLKLRSGVKRGMGLLSDVYIEKLSEQEKFPERARNLAKELVAGERTRKHDKPTLQRKVNRILPKKLMSEMYPSRCHPPVVGLDYYQLLGQSKLTFNMHTDFVANSVGNMRLFEATGVGACLLTDTGSNMKELFEPDDELVTYKTVDEAIDKLTYLLGNDDEREKIAAAGQRRTMNDHTIFRRCELIDEVIQARLT